MVIPENQAIKTDVWTGNEFLNFELTTVLMISLFKEERTDLTEIRRRENTGI